MRMQHLTQTTAFEAESSPLFVPFDFVENVLQCARQKTYQEASKYVSAMCLQTSHHKPVCGLIFSSFRQFVGPKMVYVLPLPVWPYAKIVPLWPLMHPWATLFPTISKTSCCEPLLKTLSYVNDFADSLDWSEFGGIKLYPPLSLLGRTRQHT